jgi:hypothetical protein
VPLGNADAVHRARLLVQCRRILEVALARTIERTSAAEAALEAIAALRAAGDTATDEHDSEFEFRQLQLSLLRDDITRAIAHSDSLWNRDAGSLWATLASRTLFQHMIDQLATDELNRQDPTASLRYIVQYGGRVLREFEDDPTALRDPVVLSYHAAVADAAMRLWQAHDDEAMGRRALFLYELKLLEQRPSNAGFLRGAGLLAERFDRIELSLECWRRLVSGLPAGSPAWYEARFKVLSILAQTDPKRARAVMDQHKLLHPDFGPDPWGARLRALDQRLIADEQSDGATSRGGAEGGD